MAEKKESVKLSAKDKLHLKHFVKELEKHRGRHTELVSVYVPAGYDLNKIINHLQQEQGTAANIKSAGTRNNVINALERMVQHLKLFKGTPANGLAVFSGNVAERDGFQDFKVWSIEPPVPLNIRIYRCDKEFVSDPLREMVEHEEVYGMIVVDGRDATIALLKGKTIIPLQKTHSEVPGKMRAGGQCLVPDTLIQLSDGRIEKMLNIHNPESVKSMVGNSIADSRVTDKWHSKKHVLRIVTKHPRLEIESSKDHVFFVSTINGIVEKKASELKLSDTLIMPEIINANSKVQHLSSKQYYNSFVINKKGRDLLKSKRTNKKLKQRELSINIGLSQSAVSCYELGKINPKREELALLCNALKINHEFFLEKYTQPFAIKDVKLPETVTVELAQFIGYLIGDGCIEEDRVTFFEQSKEVALEYKKSFDAYFNITSSLIYRASKNYYQLRFTSRPLVRLITKEFSEVRKSSDSVIPGKIISSDNKVLAGFLRGLFDAEGYVSNRGLSFGINNKFLARQIQMSLLRFSIISSILEYDNRLNKYSNNPRFTMDITEKQSMQTFLEQIGFTSSEKTAKLKEAIQKKTIRGYSRQIIVPGSKVRKIIEEAGCNLQLFPSVTNFFRDERKMSKQVFANSILNHVSDKILYDRLQEVYANPLLPVEINSITKTWQEADMIDISVGNGNFIANGLLVHNSAPRFARAREGAIRDHYKKVADYVKEQFLYLKDLKGILVGGPSTSTNEFVNHDFLLPELKSKIIAVKDLSYTDDFGLQELLERSADVLAEEEVAKEKVLVQKFLTLLATKPGMVSYGEVQVRNCISMGAVDIILLSEAKEELLDSLEAEAGKFGTGIEVISTETREGVQLRDLGGVAAILRYQVQH